MDVGLDSSMVARASAHEHDVIMNNNIHVG